MVDIGFIASVLGAGVLSFFTPCVLPLIPVYVAYLSADRQSDNLPMAKRLVRAFAFVAGLAVTFFILGFGAGLLGDVLDSGIFYIACGIIVFVMGLFFAGILHIPLLERERRMQMPDRVNRGTLLGAFVMGLIFSFGWTPCIGPVLAVVLALVAENGQALYGGLMLVVYAFGLGIPFVVLTLASEMVLTRVRSLARHSAKIQLIAGLVIAALGLVMVFSAASGLIERQAGPNAGIVAGPTGTISGTTASQGDDFTLPSMDGTVVSLSDYRGKPVYVKLWASWCPTCVADLPELSRLASEHNTEGDFQVLTIVAPSQFGEMDEVDFTSWAQSEGLDFPILFDRGAAVNDAYGVRAYPTSLFFDAEGRLVDTRVGNVGNADVERVLAPLVQTGTST